MSGFKEFGFHETQPDVAGEGDERAVDEPSIPWDPVPEIGRDHHDLSCPRCGHQNIHQRSVRVGARQEDSDGVVVEVSFGDGHVAVRPGSDKAQDYLGRRDDLTIQFWCEGCDGESSLAIVQHKGLTLVRWVQAHGRKGFWGG